MGKLGWLVLTLLILSSAGAVQAGSLPRRLVLAIDALAYRDVEALQHGVVSKDKSGRPVYRSAFQDGWFPVCRNVSTFPSTSDVAWTQMFGIPALPGYQRRWYDHAANRVLAVNGVFSSTPFERSVDWREGSGFDDAMAYVRPRRYFAKELGSMAKAFLTTTSGKETYYAYLQLTDHAQHMGCDPADLICAVDATLQRIQEQYRAREGRDLQIIVLSDHGNNHAGPGKRVQIKPFLKKAGYRIRKSIEGPHDVILPTSGIESWVELHCASTQTERLVTLMTRLKGADVITAIDPQNPGRFIVMNRTGERASIDWDRSRNAFRYVRQTGDPLRYSAAVQELSGEQRLDSSGFGSAEDWARVTMTHYYPVALERIANAHTTVTLNPATILVSLDNRYVHASWLIKLGSELMRSGGTHGGLDEMSSVGVFMTNFRPAHDTSTARVGSSCDGFAGFQGRRAPATSVAGLFARPGAPALVK